jgi:hypothetical protein
MCPIRTSINHAPIQRTWGPIQIASPPQKIQAKASRRIDDILRNPEGLPNGRGKRTKLSRSRSEAFKSELTTALAHACVWASHGPLPNRIRTRGRPPDNAVFIFIDDIVRACEVAGLKPGLRYVDGSESLPVRLYQELAPLLWCGTASTTPRRVFERWRRYRTSLIRF